MSGAGSAISQAFVESISGNTSRRAIRETVAAFSAVLYLFVTMDAFYVSSVAVGGERYMSREEIFRFSEVAQRHVFWIDQEDVEARLETVPNIADAEVYVGWPPDMVQILTRQQRTGDEQQRILLRQLNWGCP